LKIPLSKKQCFESILINSIIQFFKQFKNHNFMAMGQQYIGEIRMFAGDFAPLGWVICRGQLLSIGNYQALFSIIGSEYGGNGSTTFALPDFRGRLPVHFYFKMAEQGGEEANRLTMAQLPPHTHQASTQPIKCNSLPEKAINNIPTGRYPGYSSRDLSYLKDNTKPAYAANAETTVEFVGSSSPIENRMPSFCINFIIAVIGIMPSL
jgi:microcystin-dependent protein